MDVLAVRAQTQMWGKQEEGKRQSRTIGTTATPPKAVRAPGLHYRPRRTSRREDGSGERLDRAFSIQEAGLLHGQRAFPPPALSKGEEWVPLNTSAIKARGEERAATAIIPWTQTHLILQFNTQPSSRLLPDGLLQRDFGWSLKREECESGTTVRGTTPPPAEAKKGEKLRGVNSQACQAGREGQEPHAQLLALAYPEQETPASSLPQPASARPPSVPAGLQLV